MPNTVCNVPLKEHQGQAAGRLRDLRKPFGVYDHRLDKEPVNTGTPLWYKNDQAIIPPFEIGLML
jgi:hypothetical protein